MAKSHKMSRGVKSGKEHVEGKRVQLPSFVHAVDVYGNIWASLPDMDRTWPRYYTLETLKTAFEEKKTELITEEDLKLLEGAIHV